MPPLQKLPIGMQTFSRIREGDFVYIDKTPMIADMVNGAGRFFLSRPRRFGKSLLVDTLRCLFQGRKELFTGLYIEHRWDWSLKYPVIKIDFADGNLHSPEALNARIDGLLRQNAEQLGIEEQRGWDLPGRFGALIRQATQKYGHPAVVLIDEYDKPILDNIDQPEIAAQMRDGLKNLYSVLKGQDEHLRFIFMTGVTRFSKVSLFSGLNQIEDITLDQRYATLCGYTQADLENQFAGHLQGVDWEQLKDWYNGYQFLGEPVYNPYDVLLFISKQLTFRNYWFETGSPSFLIKLFLQRQVFLPDLEDIEVGEEILDSFDVENISPITLLFQAGYLTITDAFTDALGEPSFRLRLPNREVRTALAIQLIGGYTHLEDKSKDLRQRLLLCLQSADLARLQLEIQALFAGIP